jgi:hypothetical protein
MDWSNFEDKASSLSPELIERNVESWQDIVSFFEMHSSFNAWEFLVPVLRLVEQIANTELAKLFRAGQSLYHLMISTARKHGLEDGEPFVAVRLERNSPMRIEYWDTTGGDILQSDIRNPNEDVLLMLEPFLVRLWDETRRKA